MPRGILNLVLLVALVATWVATCAMHPRPAVSNWEFMPEMVRTPRYNAYSANPNFPDGKTLQAPPEGTIPRGLPPLHFSATPEDAMRAGNTLHAPAGSAGVPPALGNSLEMRAGTPALPDKAAAAHAIERGSVVFARFCQPCHGASGKGDGLVVAKGYPAPPPLAAENAINLKDGQIFHIITYGQKNMPGYATQISREDRWNVIAYVRSLQGR